MPLIVAAPTTHTLTAALYLPYPDADTFDAIAWAARDALRVAGVHVTGQPLITLTETR